MQLNYFGTLRVIKAALPDMMERRQGEIVLVSSAAAVVGATSPVPLSQLLYLDASVEAGYVAQICPLIWVGSVQAWQGTPPMHPQKLQCAVSRIHCGMR